MRAARIGLPKEASLGMTATTEQLEKKCESCAITRQSTFSAQVNNSKWTRPIGINQFGYFAKSIESPLPRPSQKGSPRPDADNRLGVTGRRNKAGIT